MIRAGIFGATGYTGHELARILSRHPQVEIAFGTSREAQGANLTDIYPRGPDLALLSPDVAPIGEVDLIFLCLPHTTAAAVAAEGYAAGTRVIDLSADFRLRQPSTFESWYGEVHPHPELLSEAVYGLSETARLELPGARLVANPGCYPTSVLLALYPLARSGAIAGPVIIDAKSGVSGAGRSPKQHLHFVEVAENLSPYSVGKQHRHLPEMEQALAGWGQSVPELIFSPHLVPVPRGLLSTIYVPRQNGWDESHIQQALESTFRGEPFIRLLPPGEHATLAHVIHTNRCAIGFSVTNGFVLMTSAIDNLIKGAAGQAVQNMNLVFEFEESDGLN